MAEWWFIWRENGLRSCSSPPWARCGEGQNLQPKFPQPSTTFQPILVSFFPFSSLILEHSFKGTLELQFLSSCCHWKGIASYFPKLIDLSYLVLRLWRYFSRKYGGSTYKFAMITFCLSYILMHAIPSNSKIILMSRLFQDVNNWSYTTKVPSFWIIHGWKTKRIFAQRYPKKPILDLKNRFCSICSNFVNLFYGLSDLHFCQLRCH